MSLYLDTDVPGTPKGPLEAATHCPPGQCGVLLCFRPRVGAPALFPTVTAQPVADFREP